MSFEIRTNNQESNNPNRVQVDWAAMNKEVVEVAQLEQPEPVIGIVSGIHDVGIQPQDDATVPWTGTEEQEREEVAKNPNTYFEDMPDYGDGGKIKRYKRFPVKDVQCCVITIDLPEIVVDKGKYFGNSDPKPLRLLLGGEFTPKGGKTIAAKPLALKAVKNDKTGNQWSIPFNNTLYKLAVATKIIKQGEAFLPQDVDKLLGKAAQFKCQVYLNQGKYYTEKCAFAAGLGRGMVAPEFDEALLSIVMFNADNKPEHLQQLRASVKNTMRNATDFEKSKIKDQIGEGFVKQHQSDDKAPVNTNVQGNANTPPSEAEEGTDDGINFDDMESSDPF